MLHFIFTKVLGWRRRVYFSGDPDRAWANYHDARGRKRWTRKLV